MKRHVMLEISRTTLIERISNKVAILDSKGVFNNDEMKLIRSRAGISLTDNYEVVLLPDCVAKLVGVSPQTVRTWCRQGKIRANRTPYPFLWWEIPLSSVYELKVTNRNFDEYIYMDIKKVDF